MRRGRSVSALQHRPRRGARRASYRTPPTRRARTDAVPGMRGRSVTERRAHRATPPRRPRLVPYVRSTVGVGAHGRPARRARGSMAGQLTPANTRGQLTQLTPATARASGNTYFAPSSGSGNRYFHARRICIAPRMDMQRLYAYAAHGYADQGEQGSVSPSATPPPQAKCRTDSHKTHCIAPKYAVHMYRIGRRYA